MKLHVKLPDAILQEFLPRCRSCYGLCCVALARSIPDGFPETRLPGEPCSFLDVYKRQPQGLQKNPHPQGADTIARLPNEKTGAQRLSPFPL